MHKRRLTLLALLLLLWQLLPGPAQATDNSATWNGNKIRWNAGAWPKGTSYYNLSSFPSASPSWASQINAAATTWRNNSPLDLYQDTSGFTINNVSRGAIPSTWTNCPPATTLACNQTGWYGDGSLASAIIVINHNFSFVTSCLVAPVPNTYDLQSVMLHEFGHSGMLNHTTDAGAVMFNTISPLCARTLTSHDINSMNAQYA